MRYEFTEEQNMILSENLENREYDEFVENVTKFTDDINLAYDLLDEYFEMLDRT